MARLTDVAVRNLKAGKERREIPDGGSGLYIVLQPTGARSYAVRYRFAGQPRKLTLPGALTLAAARKLTADALFEVEQGRDPVETKRAEKAKVIAAKADSVAAVCTEYLATEQAGGLRTFKAREDTLRHLVFPVIGGVPVSELTRSQLTRLFDKVEKEHGTRRTDLVLAYLRKALHWWELRSDSFRSPIVKGMGRYNAKEHERERVLSADELRAVWTATNAATPFNALVRFALLSGCRQGEAAGLTWDEIVDGVWHLPASRNKTKKDLARPLSKAARAIVESQPRIGPMIFTNTGDRKISLSLPKRLLDEATGITKPWVLHDLRRTARTLLSDAGVNADIAERCLGHVIGGVRAVYDRHAYQAEMAKAFEALAAQVERIVHPPADNISPLRRRDGGAA